MATSFWYRRLAITDTYSSYCTNRRGTGKNPSAFDKTKSFTVSATLDIVDDEEFMLTVNNALLPECMRTRDGKTILSLRRSENYSCDIFIGNSTSDRPHQSGLWKRTLE